MTIANRLHNPYYDLKTDFALPPNAFLHPNTPGAVIPQISKPSIQDFRSHKLAQGGYAARNTFRKTYKEGSKKSKYETIVKTQEELDNGPVTVVSASEDEIEIERIKPQKKYTVEDIMGIDNMKISKKK